MQVLNVRQLPLREIAGRYGISSSSLDRHKSHVALAITKFEEKREEKLGNNLHDEMRSILAKARELSGKMEAEGDTRGAVVALREMRECLESLEEMLARADALKGAGQLVFRVEIIGQKDKPLVM